MGQCVRNRRLALWIAVLCTALALFVPLPALAEVVASAVRLGDHGDHTRFVVELSDDITFVAFSLTGPDRIVIDLPEIEWTAPLQSNAGHGLVRRYRFGGFTPGSSRIVLDLSQPANIASAFVLKPEGGHGWRLVVNLASTTREDFTARHGRVQAGTRNIAPGSTLMAAAQPIPIRGPASGGSEGPIVLRPPPQPSTPPPSSASAPPSAQAQPTPIVLHPPSPLSSSPATAPDWADGGTSGSAAYPPLPPTPPPERHAAPPAPRPTPAAMTVPAPARAGSAPADRKPVIVLDPGHGGVDPGATSASGVFEKHITLAMGTELRDRLNASGRYKAFLTRDRDTFISLRDRVAIARSHKADLFISLHADAIARTEIRGLSVYTLSEQASDKEAAALADRENKADLIGGMDLSNQPPDVTGILIDLAQRETMNLSARLANFFLGELRREVTLLPKSHRHAGFAVLKAPDMPSVLLEMGYLSNLEEEQMLRKPAYRAKLGTALVRGVDQFFKSRTSGRP